MATPVNYTGHDLKIKLAELLIECSVRAQREDALRQTIADRDAEIASLRADLAKAKEIKKG